MVTTGANQIFLDTNILVRATVATAPDHQATQRRLENMTTAGDEMWISRQIMREYAAVLTRPQTFSAPVSSKIVAAQLRTFEEQFHLAEDNATVSANLISLLETIPLGGKQVHDANIVATMMAYGINQLLTYNGADFARFSGLVNVIAFTST
ncbi:MAG: type II toxin-antitoxin system VapC family toxin [Chloroflexi bacterium]|nr:type II toxin-antitoxin system VapC family toxin [Chloroflexota bacterium]MCC6895176.1 type II toxin-antitoxin system VapC family toxin [Anaerolineae bacterium]